MTNNYGHPNLNCQPPAFHAVGPEPRINNAVKYISNECQANSEGNTRNVVIRNFNIGLVAVCLS